MYPVVKRIMDFVFASALLVGLSPLFLLLSLISLVNLGRPVLFSQLRPGRNQKIFRMYKFRTMTEQRDSSGTLFSDESRLTRWGKFLRSVSLDELPELWNVVLGQMSFVGPRPLLVQYLPLYSEEQQRRHLVRPGITGLAQVRGRNSLSWQEKFVLDVEYVDSMTFSGDLRIIWQTFMVTFKREGISHEGNATMPPFAGES